MSPKWHARRVASAGKRDAAAGGPCAEEKAAACPRAAHLVKQKKDIIVADKHGGTGWPDEG